MGHIRLGRLYKSRKWNKVIDLLDFNGYNAAQITSATLKASGLHTDTREDFSVRT